MPVYNKLACMLILLHLRNHANEAIMEISAEKFVYCNNYINNNGQILIVINMERK